MHGAFESERADTGHPLWDVLLKREQGLYARNNEIRSEFERDYTRIIHCSAYRRLKYKTQVFFAPKNDHVCTRIEHAEHASSVSSMIAKYLGLNPMLASAIASGHEIGQPPFGRLGESCLNSLYAAGAGGNTGGGARPFWHERNSLFFADCIETLANPDGWESPLNLTYAVRDGIICHCAEIPAEGLRPRSQPADLYAIRRPGALRPLTWEGCVVIFADIIAALGRDMEDARLYHLLDMGAYRELKEIAAETLGFHPAQKGLPHSGRAVNTTVLINDLIVDLCASSSVEEGLRFSAPYHAFVSALMCFNCTHIYNHWRLREFAKYAAQVLRTIYDTLMFTFPYAHSRKVEFCLSHFPRLKETFTDWLIRYTDYNREAHRMMRLRTQRLFHLDDEESYRKCLIEYLSGMTDRFAIAVYEEIISF